MAPHRLWVAHAAIVLVAGGSLACIVAGREYWPWSHYPMFAGVERAGPVERLHLVGVVARDGSEIPILTQRYLDPFDPSRLTVVLDTLRRRDDPRALADALMTCLQRYELRRAEGRHGGPPLRGVRLYRLTWDRRDAASFHRERPDRRQLVTEVTGTGPEGR
jgi:hypothetical protein